MATVKRVHVGEVGTLFQVTIKERDINDELQVVDVSSLSSGIVTFIKGEGGDAINRTLTKQTDGNDGILIYQFIVDDLDTEGRWSWQCKVVLTSGTWYTLKGYFYVDDILA